jgi:pilus assembly protein CpaE
MMGVVRETLAAEAVLPNNSIPFEEGIETVQRTMPDVVLVGMNERVEEAIAFARAVVAENPKVTMVAISNRRDADHILSAMRVGYREFLVLPTDVNRLREVVHDAAFQQRDDGEKGLVIAVVGAKGGVGTTLISTHLSAELAAIHRVICVDCDFNMGDIAPAMDLIPKDTLADLLAKADRVDERSLTGAVAVHPSKVHFLCQPDDIERIGEIVPEELFAVIEAAAKGYQYVVLDCGCAMNESTNVLLNVADQVILVATPDVVSVRAAHRRYKLLQTIGVEKKRISFVLNRVPPKPFLTQEDIEQNIQIPVLAQVSEDSRVVDQAVNDGKLVRDVNRKAPIVLEMSQLVSLLNEDPDEIQPVREVKQEPGFFARLLGLGG